MNNNPIKLAIINAIKVTNKYFPILDASLIKKYLQYQTL